MNNKVTYRQQFTRCGKQRCRKCKEGAGHGPYWYAYWSENGRTISKYIGIHPPAGVELTPVESLLAQNQPPAGESSQSIATGTIHPASGSNETSFEATQPTPGVKAAEESHANPVLRIYLLGQLRIERRDGSAWETVTSRTWHRRRARALLGCLLSASGRRSGREQVMEALWPDLDIETAANRLNGAVHEVRQVLEPHITRPAASRMLRLERDILSLADASSIWVDADEFESLLNKANNAATNPEQVEQLLEQASTLYAGDYLIEELYSEWAARRREALRRGWMGLLLKLAELRVERGALNSAIEPLDRLLGADPTHETAVRRLMVILTQLDRRGEALRVYRHLEETLEREYESDPLPETRELYEGLRRGTFQTPRSPENPVAPLETSPLALTTGQSAIARPQPAQIAAKPAYTVFQRPTLQLGRHNQSKLIGREGELTAMQHFLLALEKIGSEQAQEDQEAASGKPRVESVKESATRSDRQRRAQKFTHFLVLMGESGIGKTRLAEEISYEANMRNWSVVWAHAYEQEGTIPYRPWTEILRALLKDVPAEFLLESLETIDKPEAEGAPSRNSAPSSSSPAHSRLSRLRTLVPELAAHLTLDDALSNSSSPLTPEQERLHLWEATTALFSVLSHSTPLLFVLDDLHWTDDSSLELLAYVVRHMPNERIAIVATCRDIELTPNSSLRTLLNDLRREQALISLPVQPLDDGQIGSLVAHLPQSIIKSIQSQAGGNPFFAEELARASEIGLPLFTPLEGNALALSTQAGESEKETRGAHSSMMPETITAVLDRRLSRLSNDCQTLLGKVAVLGGSFEFNQLAYMVGDQGISEDAILDMLEEALRAGLLTEEGTGSHITYNFWHPLIVNHLYNRLSAARRAQLHRRAANALMLAHPGSEQEVAAAITYHLSKGGGDTASIARYAELAANRAYALSAYSEAEHYYRIAIEAISSETQEKTQSVEDPLHLASLLERVAECNNIHGNYEEVRRLYERVLELRAQYSPDESHQKCQTEAQRRALILREIGRAWAEISNFDNAWECYEQAKQIMLDAGVTSGAAWACLHGQQGNINWHRGNYDAARRYAQEALTILEESMQNQQRDKPNLPITSSELPTRTALSMIGSALEVGRCHELLGILAATLGQYSEALMHLQRALVIFEQHDEVSALTMVYGNLGAVYAMLAENEIARTYFKRALEMAERNSDHPNVAFVTGNLGDVAARCGDLPEAEEWMRRSIAVSERISEREQLSWNNVVLAGILQDQGDMQGALAYIRRGLALARAIKSARFTGFALVTLGDWRIARAIEVRDIHFIDANTHVTLRKNGGSAILARARKALERALTLEKLDAEVNIEGRLNLAIVSFLLGNVEQAGLLASQSMKDAQEHELARVLARSQRLLGRILAAQGKAEEADAYFEQAIEVFSRHEMRLDYARSLHGYGVTLLQRGAPGESLFQRGLAYLQEARAIFAQCKAAIDVEWVERILAHYDYENARV